MISEEHEQLNEQISAIRQQLGDPATWIKDPEYCRLMGQRRVVAEAERTYCPIHNKVEIFEVSAEDLEFFGPDYGKCSLCENWEQREANAEAAADLDKQINS